MKDFNFSLGQNIIFGVGATDKLPELLKEKGFKSVMIVTDESLINLGFADKITDILKNSNINYTIFSDIEPNPSIETVNKAAEFLKKSEAEVILAFGGGSPMDVAKAMAVLATFGGKITDYEGTGNVPEKVMPIIAIPTTAGTGSEVTASSVVTDHERNFKFTIVSPHIIPDYAIVDPSFILSLPKELAAATGMDAIVHALEAYISINATPITDCFAEKALDLLGDNIRAFTKDRNDVEAASAMLLGSTFAGIAFARARLGNVHAMAHPLGGIFDIPHGVANAVLLPYVMKYNLDYIPNEKLEKIYRCIKRDFTAKFNKNMVVDAIFEVCSELGIPKTLSKLNVTKESIPKMAEDSMKSGNAKVNPRPTSAEDIEKIFLDAM